MSHEKLLSLVVVAALTQWSATASAYEETNVPGGGHIEGTVSYNGVVPVTKIIPTKDQQVCGGPRDEPSVYLDADNRVQDAVVYLKAVSKGKPWPRQDKTPVLDNHNCRFDPPLQIIRAGELTIHNSDPVLHNTHGFYGRRTAFNVALPSKDMQVTRELPRPGMVRVECDAHGWMLGHVFVADNPYYALTGKDGSFSIRDVPPGDYTLVVSQYYLGDTATPVTVKAGAATKLTIDLKKQ